MIPVDCEMLFEGYNIIDFNAYETKTLCLLVDVPFGVGIGRFFIVTEF